MPLALESAPTEDGEPAMWIRLFTIATTWLLSCTVFGLATLFLAASWTEGLLDFVVTYGHWLTLGTILLFPLAVLLRFRAGLMMLRRGNLDDAIRYCQPRAQVTLTVGRDEAAVNRYVAAEAFRRQGDPATSLKLLEQESPAPFIAAHRQLLSLARALALSALSRSDEANAIVESLGDLLSREVKRASDTFAAIQHR